MIVPFSAGNQTDMLARLVGKKMSVSNSAISSHEGAHPARARRACQQVVANIFAIG